MTTEDFVKGVYQIKQELLESYFEIDNETHVGELVKSLQLDSEQIRTLKDIVDGALADGFYSLLIGIEGGASIGDNLQQELRLLDKENNSLSENIGGIAYKYFQELE